MVKTANLTRNGFANGDISTVMSLEPLLHGQIITKFLKIFRTHLKYLF